MNFGHARTRLVQAGAVLAAAVLVAGCGANYRPVVTPTNGSGPAAEPESFVVAVSAPSTTAYGIATIIDYSGDSVEAQAALGVNPIAFTVDEAGANGYSLNSDGTLTGFPVSLTLQEKQVTYTTLPSTAKPLNLFSPSSGLWVADLCGTYISSLCGSAADVFAGSPEKEQSSVSVATTPVMVVGPSIVGQRNFAISQNISTPTGVECNSSPTTQPLGTVTGIEVSTDTPDPTLITVGRCPVYAVESNASNLNNSQRLFVLNRGSDTISVINTLTGALDGEYDAGGNCVPFLSETGQTVTCHPTLPLSQAALNAADVPPNCNFTSDPTCSLPADGGLLATAGPVYAEYNAVTSQLVVANYDGGTVSIIDVSLDEYGNDSPTFGTTYTVKVGNNPASVTALFYNGSYAYTANQADETVSVVNLSSHRVEATLPVTGHPRTVVSTQSSEEYGKVYVASPDSPYLTIINAGGTGMNTVDTTLLLGAGNLVDVRVSAQNGVSGNSNNVSRLPGYGQPCNLPDAGPTASLTACQTQ